MTDCASRTEELRSFLGLQALDLNAGELFEALVDAGFGELPLPMNGATAERFSMLREVGRQDLSAARLFEGHADALAILAEAGVAPPAGARLGVWTAGPLSDLTATPATNGWCLYGRKNWCSGAPLLTHTVVNAETEQGGQLFIVALADRGVSVVEGSWPAVGMAGSLTVDVEFDGVVVGVPQTVGEPNFYLSRRGFWIGSVGVAAVWLGGAEGIAALLARRAGKDPHRLAHLGAVSARLFTLDVLVERAARAIDGPPLNPMRLERLARIVRTEVEAGATEILERTGRATGADPLGHDAADARRVADLTVYLRQSHGEIDLALLGELELQRMLDDQSR